jgi:hypothetical protein
LNSSKSGKVALQDYLAERVGAVSSTDKRSALTILAERINSTDSHAGSDPSVLNLQGHTYLQAFLLLDAGVINLPASAVNAQLLPRIGSLAATTRDLPWANPDGSGTFSKPESMSREDFDRIVGATANVKRFIDWLKNLGQPVSNNPGDTLIASNGSGLGIGTSTGGGTALPGSPIRTRSDLEQIFPEIFTDRAIIRNDGDANAFVSAYNIEASKFVSERRRFHEIDKNIGSDTALTLAEQDARSSEAVAQFRAAGLAEVERLRRRDSPTLQDSYFNGWVISINNSRAARDEAPLTENQVAVGLAKFKALRDEGVAEADAAAAAIAAAAAAPAEAAGTQPAVPVPPPIIDLATLTSWTASAKAVAIATGNPTGVIMANAIETVLGALTTLSQTNAQLKDGVAGNAIATLARGSAKTFAAVVELIGKGDIKAFVAVVNDIAQFATGNERAGFANGLKSIGSLAQVLGTKDRNPALLFASTVFNEISGVVAIGGTSRERLDANGQKIPARDANGNQRTETKNGVTVPVWEMEPVPGLIEGKAIQAGARVLKKFGELSGDKTIQGAAEALLGYGQFVELSRNGTPGDGTGALVMGLGKGVNLMIGGKTGQLVEDLSAVA